jgi:parallel beta-helix repeat protein
MSTNGSASVEFFGAVGDGSTNDTAAIQQAIDSGARTICGTPGKVYLIDGMHLDALTGVRLVGNGAALKFASIAAQVGGTGGSAQILLSSCVSCEISGWEIDGNGMASNAIAAIGCADLKIADNEIRSCGALALVFVTGGVRTQILRNKGRNGLGRGFWIGNYTAAEIETDASVKDNTVYANGASGIIVASVGGAISGNLSHNNAGSGIVFGGANGFISRDLSITGNTCRANAFHGIQSDVVGTADLPSGVTISANICSGSTSGVYAVNMSGGAISGNICQDNIYGILVEQSSGLTVNGNRCADSRIGVARTQLDGIRVVSQTGIATERIALVGNSCENNLGNGIFVVNSGAGRVRDVSVGGNAAHDNGRGIAVIEVAAGDIAGVIVEGNNANGNTVYDLRMSLLDVTVGHNHYSTQHRP